MTVLSRARLLTYKTPEHRCVPLSILDATVARFAPTSAIWVYSKALPTTQLADSLKATLHFYPQWIGQLRYAGFDPNGPHTGRGKRLVLEYGTENDPGVELIIATSTLTLLDLTPVSTSRDQDIFDATNFPLGEFMGTSTQLALQNVEEFEGLPCMIVQITTLMDDGMAIAVKMSHPIADAQTLVQFMHDWARVNEAIGRGESCPELGPVFDPQLLDHAMAGNFDASEPDPAILEVAAKLPLHRYDWWASSSDSPHFFTSATQILPGLDEKQIGPMGTALPWSEWDYTVPVSHMLVTFNAKEMHNIYLEASATSRVSHLDALLAHMWSLIGRARDLEDEEEFYLDNTFGFRKRLDPPLPSTFVGSPLTLSKVSATGKQAKDRDLGVMAANIRAVLGAFNPSTLPSLLHEMVHYSSAQRYWNGFLGRRNTIVTSWLELGTRRLDFGSGTPSYVDAIIPPCDGCMQVVEAHEDGGGHDSGAGRWYDGPVKVSLYLREDVMGRVLKDPDLRRYRKP